MLVLWFLARTRSIRVQLLAIALGTTLLAAVFVVALIHVVEYVPLREGVVERALYAWERGAAKLPYAPKTVVHIVNSGGWVIYTLGGAACPVGERLADCRNGAAAPTEGAAHFERDGQAWETWSTHLPGGPTLIIQARVFTAFDELRSFAGTVLYYASLAALSAIPIALLLSLLMARPLVRRLHHIAAASRAFASGDLAARTGEVAEDDIGLLGRQFDVMAQRIGVQMGELRRLAGENSRLAQVAERHARQAERAALSRDLHDTVSQHLFSLAMGTSDLAALVRRDPIQAAGQAEQLAAIAAQAQDELRGVLVQLRPSPLTSRGLLESLRELAGRWSQDHGVALETQLASLALPLALEDVLYRVAQEALHNIARHAAARHATLVLVREADRVVLLVTDDGRGIDLERPRTGLGLVGMRERVQTVGGDVLIDRSPGGGTRVRVSIVLAKESHAN